MKQTETILTITGSDGTGDSGIQADIRTISAMGGSAVSVITSITLQNTLGIQEFFDLPADVVEGQIEAVADDVNPQIVKVGMLHTVELVTMVARMLRKYRPRHVVYDPVVRSARGDVLMSPEVQQAVTEQLVPLCTYVVGRQEHTAHGRGNLFASAMCVCLSRGERVDEAAAHARQYAEGLGDVGKERPGTGRRAGELYQRFVQAVERFFRCYNDVAFYAEQLGVGSRYLGQVTHRVAGQSPKAIIEARLLTEAERLLAEGSKPLKAIAAELGFSSQAHLARFFRKQRGMAPSDFRHMAKHRR